MIDPRAILSLALLAVCGAALALCRRRSGPDFLSATVARAAADLFLSGPVFESWVFGLRGLPFDLYTVQALSGLLTVVAPRAVGAFFALLAVLATVFLSPHPSEVATYGILAARFVLFLYAARLRRGGAFANGVRTLFHASVVLPILAGMPFVAATLLNLPVAAPSAFRSIGAAFLGLAGLFLLAAGTVEFSKRSATPDPADASDRLITTGVYSRLRNPIQIAQILLIVSAAVWKGGHWAVFAVAAFEAAFLVFLIRPLEERHLASRFGGAFENYRSRVPAYFLILRSCPRTPTRF